MARGMSGRSLRGRGAGFGRGGSRRLRLSLGQQGHGRGGVSGVSSRDLTSRAMTRAALGQTGVRARSTQASSINPFFAHSQPGRAARVPATPRFRDWHGVHTQRHLQTEASGSHTAARLVNGPPQLEQMFDALVEDGERRFGGIQISGHRYQPFKFFEHYGRKLSWLVFTVIVLVLHFSQEDLKIVSEMENGAALSDITSTKLAINLIKIYGFLCVVSYILWRIIFRSIGQKMIRGRQCQLATKAAHQAGMQVLQLDHTALNSAYLGRIISFVRLLVDKGKKYGSELGIYSNYTSVACALIANASNRVDQASQYFVGFMTQAFHARANASQIQQLWTYLLSEQANQHLFHVLTRPRQQLFCHWQHVPDMVDLPPLTLAADAFRTGRLCYEATLAWNELNLLATFERYVDSYLGPIERESQGAEEVITNDLTNLGLTHTQASEILSNGTTRYDKVSIMQKIEAVITGAIQRDVNAIQRLSVHAQTILFYSLLKGSVQPPISGQTDDVEQQQVAEPRYYFTEGDEERIVDYFHHLARILFWYSERVGRHHIGLNSLQRTKILSRLAGAISVEEMTHFMALLLDGISAEQQAAFAELLTAGSELSSNVFSSLQQQYQIRYFWQDAMTDAVRARILTHLLRADRAPQDTQALATIVAEAAQDVHKQGILTRMMRRHLDAVAQLFCYQAGITDQQAVLRQFFWHDTVSNNQRQALIRYFVRDDNSIVLTSLFQSLSREQRKQFTQLFNEMPELIADVFAHVVDDFTWDDSDALPASWTEHQQLLLGPKINSDALRAFFAASHWHRRGCNWQRESVLQLPKVVTLMHRSFNENAEGRFLIEYAEDDAEATSLCRAITFYMPLLERTSDEGYSDFQHITVIGLLRMLSLFIYNPVGHTPEVQASYQACIHRIVELYHHLPWRVMTQLFTKANLSTNYGQTGVNRQMHQIAQSQLLSLHFVVAVAREQANQHDNKPLSVATIRILDQLLEQFFIKAASPQQCILLLSPMLLVASLTEPPIELSTFTRASSQFIQMTAQYIETSQALLQFGFGGLVAWQLRAPTQRLALVMLHGGQDSSPAPRLIYAAIAQATIVGFQSSRLDIHNQVNASVIDGLNWLSTNTDAAKRNFYAVAQLRAYRQILASAITPEQKQSASQGLQQLTEQLRRILGKATDYEVIFASELSLTGTAVDGLAYSGPGSEPVAIYSSLIQARLNQETPLRVSRDTRHIRSYIDRELRALGRFYSDTTANGKRVVQECYQTIISTNIVFEQSVSEHLIIDLGACFVAQAESIKLAEGATPTMSVRLLGEMNIPTRQAMIFFAMLIARHWRLYHNSPRFTPAQRNLAALQMQRTVYYFLHAFQYVLTTLTGYSTAIASLREIINYIDPALNVHKSDIEFLLMHNLPYMQYDQPPKAMPAHWRGPGQIADTVLEYEGVYQGRVGHDGARTASAGLVTPSATLRHQAVTIQNMARSYRAQQVARRSRANQLAHQRNRVKDLNWYALVHAVGLGTMDPTLSALWPTHEDPWLKSLLSEPSLMQAPDSTTSLLSDGGAHPNAMVIPEPVADAEQAPTREAYQRSIRDLLARSRAEVAAQQRVAESRPPWYQRVLAVFSSQAGSDSDTVVGTQEEKGLGQETTNPLLRPMFDDGLRVGGDLHSEVSQYQLLARVLDDATESTAVSTARVSITGASPARMPVGASPLRRQRRNRTTSLLGRAQTQPSYAAVSQRTDYTVLASGAGGGTRQVSIMTGFDEQLQDLLHQFRDGNPSEFSRRLVSLFRDDAEHTIVDIIPKLDDLFQTSDIEELVGDNRQQIIKQLHQAFWCCLQESGVTFPEPALAELNHLNAWHVDSAITIFAGDGLPEDNILQQRMLYRMFTSAVQADQLVLACVCYTHLYQLCHQDHVSETVEKQLARMLNVLGNKLGFYVFFSATNRSDLQAALEKFHQLRDRPVWPFAPEAMKKAILHDLIRRLMQANAYAEAMLIIKELFAMNTDHDLVGPWPLADLWQTLAIKEHHCRNLYVTMLNSDWVADIKTENFDFIHALYAQSYRSESLLGHVNKAVLAKLLASEDYLRAFAQHWLRARRKDSEVVEQSDYQQCPFYLQDLSDDVLLPVYNGDKQVQNNVVLDTLLMLLIERCLHADLSVRDQDPMSGARTVSRVVEFGGGGGGGGGGHVDVVETPVNRYLMVLKQLLEVYWQTNKTVKYDIKATVSPFCSAAQNPAAVISYSTNALTKYFLLAQLQALPKDPASYDKAFCTTLYFALFHCETGEQASKVDAIFANDILDPAKLAKAMRKLSIPRGPRPEQKQQVLDRLYAMLLARIVKTHKLPLISTSSNVQVAYFDLGSEQHGKEKVAKVLKQVEAVLGITGYAKIEQLLCPAADRIGYWVDGDYKPYSFGPAANSLGVVASEIRAYGGRLTRVMTSMHLGQSVGALFYLTLLASKGVEYQQPKIAVTPPRPSGRRLTISELRQQRSRSRAASAVSSSGRRSRTPSVAIGKSPVRNRLLSMSGSASDGSPLRPAASASTAAMTSPLLVSPPRRGQGAALLSSSVSRRIDYGATGEGASAAASSPTPPRTPSPGRRSALD